MEETKEVFKIISKQDATEFREIANGRKFFKIGESITDICEQEVDRHNYENANIFVKIFKAKKYKKNKYMIENRISSCIRAIAAKYIRESNKEEYNVSELTLEVKQVISKKVEEYEEIEKKKKENENNVIDMKIKKEA